MKFETFFKIFLSAILSIIGFLLMNSLTTVNQNIAEISKDIVSIKLQVTEIQCKILDESKVRQLCKEEITKYHFKN